MDSAEITRLQDITSRLELVRRLFDADSLTHEHFDAKAVASYYTQSAIGYRWVHSTAGSIHMALNPDGVFDRSGYYGQVKRIESMFSENNEKRSVLELGSGMGFNSLHLAQAWPLASFVGIDLTPLHVQKAIKKSRGQPNTEFLLGDFHRLSFEDDSFDLVFSIESVCHATDLRKVLDEIFRVLHPGGKVVIFDGYRRPDFQALDEQIKLAARLAEAAMAVERPWVIDDWLNVASDAGFRLLTIEDLSKEIMPNLRRFERIARAFFERRLLSRVLRRILPPRLIRNTVAGLLLAATSEAGAHQYNMIVLERPA